MIKILYFFCLHRRHIKIFEVISNWLMNWTDNYAIWGIDSLPYPSIKGFDKKPDKEDEVYISKTELEMVFTDMLSVYYKRITNRKLKKKEKVVENTIKAMYKTFTDQENKSLWKRL